MTTKLFAWTSPAFASGSPVDHTWVTTYDNRAHAYPNASAVASANEDYWFCWGAFRTRGGTPGKPDGFLGQQPGDLNLARCLVASNQDSNVASAARGTIFVYGVDGVCHQLANQVLYATGQSGRPMTVKGARGYLASTFIYQMYGLQHAAWAARKLSCGGGATAATDPGLSSMNTSLDNDPNAPDDFEEQARKALGNEPQILARLLALRAEVHSFAMHRLPGAMAPSAETLNARNQHMLDAAAELLGPQRFENVFGYSPKDRINLVVPSIRDEPDLPPLKAN